MKSRCIALSGTVLVMLTLLLPYITPMAIFTNVPSQQATAVPVFPLYLPHIVRPSSPPMPPSLFRFIRTVKVTPDDNFKTGRLGYIHYVPATDRFVVMLVTRPNQPVPLINSGEMCTDNGGGIWGNAFKEYYTDMTPTGNFGYISCHNPDLTTQMIGDTLYLVHMTAWPPTSPSGEETHGWHLDKFSAVTWEKQAETDVVLEEYPHEQQGGPTIAYVKGEIVVSGEYRLTEAPEEGKTWSHHRFFSLDLVSTGRMRLLDPPHMPELSIIETDDALYVLGATACFGDLLMIRYDKNWNYLESKVLREKAWFPTGAVWDGQRFYIAYVDTSRRDDEQDLLVTNVRLAAYDSNWNLLDDVAVTNFTPDDDKWGMGPWLMKHGNQLFVSYILEPLDAFTNVDASFQTWVSVYDLLQGVP